MAERSRVSGGGLTEQPRGGRTGLDATARTGDCRAATRSGSADRAHLGRRGVGRAAAHLAGTFGKPG